MMQYLLYCATDALLFLSMCSYLQFSDTSSFLDLLLHLLLHLLKMLSREGVLRYQFAYVKALCSVLFCDTYSCCLRLLRQRSVTFRTRICHAMRKYGVIAGWRQTIYHLFLSYGSADTNMTMGGMISESTSAMQHASVLYPNSELGRQSGNTLGTIFSSKQFRTDMADGIIDNILHRYNTAFQSKGEVQVW